MEIEFKLKNKEKVDIIGINDKGERKEIGHIFTPSSSGEDILNAIQICGFTEAFDLWGCGLYGKPKYDLKKERYVYKQVYAVKDGRILKDAKGNPVKEETDEKEIEQVKDIQLKFDLEVRPHSSFEAKRDSFDNPTYGCHKCFNEPCTCETIENYANPYTVKRTQDLHLENKKAKEIKTKEQLEAEALLQKLQKSKNHEEKCKVNKEITAKYKDIRTFLLALGPFKDVPMPEDGTKKP